MCVDELGLNCLENPLFDNQYILKLNNWFNFIFVFT